ncbi:probable mannitol dehydrogenase [Rhododendron vialii]|uniref:probable mannitol dehydrogenase n=1 Tax=Rhododendron vialii TaxID=182163 RepID=UPI00265E59F3|nr:probable mannitol dehydrogenase [Rhododendron vialii]
MAKSSGVKALGYAARDNSGFMSPFIFTRRATGDDDVRVKILYCGICHTDLHRTKNQWGDAKYPMVPGHEITGVVAEVGGKVQNFKIGDRVGVGCMVGSCLSCVECDSNLENYCAKRILTYNNTYYDGTNTYGGYSDHIVVKEHFVVRIPDNLPLDVAAPLLCAGITVYSPMKFFGLDKPGLHLGVVGLGGHGHICVKFAKAFGAKVTVISSSPDKKKDAIDRFGADAFIYSEDANEMQAAMNTMDGIIDVASKAHSLQPYIGMLKTHGKLIALGSPSSPNSLPVVNSLVGGRKTVAGSTIGGLKETQEVIDFAAKHNIAADIELIPMDYVNTAIERMEKVDIRYRFVIDVGKTLSLMNLPIGDVYIVPPNKKGTPTTQKDSCCCQYL